MITAALLLLTLAAVPADEVELTGGTVVEGKVEDLGDSIRVVRSNGSAVYPKSMIRKITPKKTVEEIYEDKARALKAADLDGHLQLARWCVHQKLAKESLLEFQKVLALDPDHAEARAASGFQKINGRWLPEDEANAAKGLVKYKGKWTTPELRDLDLAMEEKKELDKALQHEVGVQIGHLKSSVEKTRQDAVEALARIDDRFKVKAYLQAVTHPNRELRKFVFQELGRMKEPAALKPLVRRSLWDDDADLRPVAYRAVQDIGHPDAALFYLPFLAEESISARIRCVEAMSAFKDLRVVPALLQALENNIDLTRSFDKEGEQMAQLAQRTIVMGDGSSVFLPRSVRMARTFDVLDKNSRAKLQQEKSTILSTLGSITGQSFGEDFAGWRAWLDKKKAGNG